MRFSFLLCMLTIVFCSQLRLTFWLSNAVVLREIISQSFGSSCSSSSLTKILESSGGKKGDGKHLSLKPSSNGVLHFIDNWQESRTFTAALERVESWIFSRIVESIWWQVSNPQKNIFICRGGKELCVCKAHDRPL